MKDYERHEESFWDDGHVNHLAFGDDGHECRYVTTY